jgi:hypothetical protein
MIRRCAVVLLSVGLLSATTACGYHLTGKGSNLPEHVKIIGVPAFENRTTRPELGQRITEKITQELVKRGKYKIVATDSGADAVMTGSVDGWTARPVQLGTERSEASRVAVTLRASVRFVDKVSGEPIYENDAYAFTREYDVIGDPDAYFDTELGAVDEVAQDFARAVVSACLQGF